MYIKRKRNSIAGKPDLKYEKCIMIHVPDMWNRACSSLQVEESTLQPRVFSCLIHFQCFFSK